MSATLATLSMKAYKTNVLVWRMLITSSMKAAIHLRPNNVSNSEIYKNIAFEDIESVFNITQKLVMEHSEEILHLKCLEYSSLSWTRSVLPMIKRSNGRRQKYVSMLISFYVWDR